MVTKYAGDPRMARYEATQVRQSNTSAGQIALEQQQREEAVTQKKLVGAERKELARALDADTNRDGKVSLQEALEALKENPIGQVKAQLQQIVELQQRATESLSQRQALGADSNGLPTGVKANNIVWNNLQLNGHARLPQGFGQINLSA